ncbi:MAG: 23S rRNA (uracil(1939)-C(5))-methyltransferase RlmD [Clostridia bacterium]|nr:23S rRNA (uracil(1939)-C(5))-methyltransferase RlmD [Clostridia bacterium]
MEPTKRSSCPYYKKCGGCQLRNLTYAAQLKHKQINCIKLLGGFCHVNEIVGMDDPARYRCKASAAFAKRRGQTVAGIYRTSRHAVVPVASCAIQDADCDAVINAVLRLARELDIGIFDENRLKGGLRHVQVRKGLATGQIMAILVTGERRVGRLPELVRKLCAAVPQITTVVQNINGGFTAMVTGDENVTLYGPGYIEDELLGLRFRISPGAFYQVNPRQTEKLYSLALDAMALSGRETVFDAYCGTGTIGLLAAKRGAGRVIGAELSQSAVDDARANAEINGIANAEFVCADAGEYACALAEKGEKCDVLVMDPPRTGSDKRFLSAVCALAPDRIVYVSCNPETLARDLRFLTQNGYKAKRITPVDMFPYTEHVETVCLLSRQ